MRKMKDSGVEWIGEIPEDWKTIRNKYLLKEMYSGGTPSATNDDFYSEEGIPFVSISDMSSIDYVRNTNKRISKAGIADKNLKVLPIGTILYSIYATVGAISELKIEATISQAMLALTLKRIINKKYYKYNLSAMREHIFSNANGNTQFNLNAEKVKNFTFVFPPLSTQHRIADYLDNKCAKIDSIIEREQAVIEKLKAYKLSVITETVTKGLDPNVPMKDSGIDLCTEIPSNWSISRIKFLFQLRDEKNYLPLEEVKLLSLYTELGVFPHGEQEERGNKAVTADGYKVVYEKDIVVNIILAWMGAIGVSNYDGVTSPAYDIYKPFNNVHSKFYHYLFRTSAFSAECYKYGRGIMAMRWRTYSTEFKSIVVPVPPFEDQKLIVDYLDNKCSKINSAIDKKQSLIDKLTEYKKSLIYEVVTGKKEV